MAGAADALRSIVQISIDRTYPLCIRD
ncbi:MAG: hypothetical protein ACD_13C00117G0001, partial [uncultured bacterium]